MMALATLLVVSLFGTEDPLRPLVDTVERAEVVRARFSQDKRIPGFDVPFRSSGRVLVVREFGVAWFTEQPIVSRTVMHTGGSGSGAVVARLLAVMGGDLSGLSATFHVSATRSPTEPLRQWTIELTPKIDAVAAVVRRIEVRGGRFVELVVLTEVSGDVTTLRLDGHVTSVSPTPEERQTFSGPRD